MEPFGKGRKAKYDPRRVPPGQVVSSKWPVLHYGSIPRFDSKTWDFRVFGEVEQQISFTYDEFRALPTRSVTADMHCVTQWSTLDNIWEGVAFRELMKRIQPKPGSRFVMVHCDGGYTTNLPLELLLDDDVLLAWRNRGQDLTPEHGYPLRLVVPKRYAWKSAKWVTGVEFMLKDRPGFWERNGYHMHGDPWKEERYGGWR